MSTVNTNDNQNNKKQRLELTWIGKEEQLKLEPRILIEDPEKSYGEKNTGNMLIHGDNLLALKALEQDFAGKIKCIYIDPPYNTGSAFEHYDDNLEHSTWLNLMKPRLELLHKLLSENGVIFISIDDNELAYLIIVLDEIFGRRNFVNNISIRVSPPNGVKLNHADKTILKEKEHIVVYAKDKTNTRFNPQYIKNDEWDGHYNKWIVKNDSENTLDWEVKQLSDILKELNLQADLKNNKFLKFIQDNHSCIFQAVGLSKIKDNPKYNVEGIIPIDESPGYFAHKNRQVQFLTNSMKNTVDGFLPAKLVTDLWNDISFNNLFQEGGVEFKNGKKPERLIKRCFDLVTKENDYVLDSFLGSGTTAAVAHKMGRRWIGIELGDHANTHCIPRIKDVVDNIDSGGITKVESWEGGGGFKFFNLAPSLLRKDKLGNWVIDEKYNPNMLAAAMCKHEGFRYSPDEEIYWKQGKSTENDYIFVTTNYLAPDQLDSIHEEMGSQESLLICAKTYAQECENKYPNITIKKIPQAILGSCEFGTDNYDLNIIEMTGDIAVEQEEELTDE